MGPDYVDPRKRDKRTRDGFAKDHGPHASGPPKFQNVGSRELANIRHSLIGRKNSPKRLQLALAVAQEMPVVREICRQVGIGRSTLDYWLSKSERGQVGDGFDIPTGETDEDGKPVTERFHKQLQHALMNGVEKVEVAAFEIATDGRAEPLVHKGRLQYQIDQDLVDLGFPLSECYVRGPNGKPLPESIFKQDPEMMRFILQARKPEMYGKRERHDHVVSGGVLVVGVKKTAAELEKAYGGVQEIQDVEFVEVEDGK